MRKILLIFALLGMFVIGACSVGVVSAQEQWIPEVAIYPQDSNGDYRTFVIVDEITGVNYIVVSVRSVSNTPSVSIQMTPRFNADGSLYITK